MEIEFFNTTKYSDIFKNYEYGKIVDLIEYNRNIYVWDSLQAYIYDNGKYNRHYAETDLTETLSKIEVCYTLARLENNTDIFTEKGFLEYKFNLDKGGLNDRNN